jgi:hypothetical protein
MDNQQYEALKLVGELSGKMEQLLNISKGIINDLPEEEKAQLAFVNNDISQIKKCVKNGDFSGLEQLTKKYAGINTER